LTAHPKKKKAGAQSRARSAHRSAGPSSGASASRAAAAGRASADARLEVERHLRAQLAALTGGLAPDDYAKAWWAWYLNVATQPPRQAALAQSAYDRLLDNWQFAARAASGVPLPPEHAELGFGDPAWNAWPFNVYARAYANWASWWQQALEPPAASDPSLSRARFAGRLLLDAASPANFLQTNPELLKKTVAESGQNLIRGLRNWLEDAQRAVAGTPGAAPSQFQVGKDVAVTPGKVVYRNRLIELLQYAPQTSEVCAEPVLITPAWIMKYYILDLSPRNSLVRYLVEQGHTVFMISWKNPGAADRDLGLDDYVQLGFFEALREVQRIVPQRRVHAVGYCIGGTLLAIAAAQLAERQEKPLASITLLAAQTDFSEPGELSVFITPSQIAMLEAMMNETGVLESERMGAAFALLRSRDLMWAPAVEQYVRGERPSQNDLMAWNADGTRMPWRMHSEYLERLYLKNELAAGELSLRGRKLDLARVRLPMFVVGTETDHVAPWRSVYKARALTRSPDYTFLLTSGGHNAGIVSGPAHPRRRHRMLTWSDATTTLPPDEWLKRAPLHQGSWWPAWQRWLAQHSAARREPARALAPQGDAAGDALGDAPGRYVRE
jgi:polyhydroxyalkanoate synthase subunit PhaC